jgi:hypothetical protein
VTENKFEKSRKGRGINQILLANGKIAEVIFSTLLNIALPHSFAPTTVFHQSRSPLRSFFKTVVRTK